MTADALPCRKDTTMNKQNLCAYLSVVLAAVTLCLLAQLVFRHTTGTQGFTGDPSAIEAAAAGVVKLQVYDSHDEQIATGTGFCAFDERTLVTAAHVVVDMKYMIASRDDGTRFRVDALIDTDETSDTALCRLPEDAGLPVLPTAAAGVRRGEPVAAIGTMYGIGNMVLPGNVCGTWSAGGTDWILFTAPISAGCSGGPLINDAGEVIGVMAGSYDSADSLKLAAPIDGAENLLP